MFPTEQSALTSAYALRPAGLRPVTVVAVATVCATLAFFSIPTGFNTVLMAQSTASTTPATAVSTVSVSAPRMTASAAAYANVAAAPLAEEAAETYVLVQPAVFPAPVLFAFGVVAMAAGAFLLSVRRALPQRPAPLDVVSIAPYSGYKVVPRASTALAATPSGGAGERYEVSLQKPIGITLGRGNDGATYVLRVPPGPKFEMFTPGDRITKCSASFGPDIWEALNFGQVMFAIKTRSGDVYLELEKRGGDMSIFEAERNNRFKIERASGNYGAGTAEEQLKNYNERQEAERLREAMWREAVEQVQKKKYEDALVVFENIIGLEPNGYVGDSFSLRTELFKISHYQMACVYSMMGNSDASLESLREALNAGFEDFKQIRTDPELSRVRESEEFEDLMSRYDESVFNAEALGALKNIFGGFFGGKK